MSICLIYIRIIADIKTERRLGIMYSGSFTGVGMVYANVDLAATLFKAVVSLLTATDEEVPGKQRSRASREITADLPVHTRAGFLQVIARELSVRKYCASTAGKYLKTMGEFFDWVDKRALSRLGEEHISGFLDSLAASGQGDAVQRLSLSTLRTVLDDVAGLDITTDISYAPRPPEVHPATRSEIEKLLTACATPSETVLIMLLNALELRPGQIVWLRWRDFDLKKRVLLRRDMRKDRIVVHPLPPALIPHLLAFLKGGVGSADDCLYHAPADRKKPMTVRGIQKRIASIGARCDLSLTCTAIRKAPLTLPGKGVKFTSQPPKVGPRPITITAVKRKNLSAAGAARPPPGRSLNHT
jgi:integrase